MSKLSKKLNIKRKRQNRKERDKQDYIPETKQSSIFDPEVRSEKGLTITCYRLKGLKHKAMKIGGFNYQSAADFSVDKGWINYWGSAFDITTDIHGNYVLYWKKRFPLFDSFDFDSDERHYRVILPCLSKEEAEQKIAFIKSNQSLRLMGFENNLYYLRDHYEQKEFRQLLPFVFYEDTVSAFTVEVRDEENSNNSY